MAGAPPGFGDALARKYDIQQQTATSEAGLRSAQGQGILGALPSENALRSAQAFSTREQGQTLGPLSAASIASTYAGIPGQQAQAGLYNAQAHQINAGFEAATPEEIANALRNMRVSTEGSFAMGTANVPPRMGNLPGMHEIMQHALRAIHAAAGMTTVANAMDPIPGQQGSWEGPLPNPNTPQPAPQPPVFYPVPSAPPRPGQQPFGKRNLNAAGGATQVAGAMDPIPGQQGSWEGPLPNPNTPQPAPQPPVFYPVPSAPPRPGQQPFGKRNLNAAGGAANVRPSYAGGKSKVPGKGSGAVDTVPAMLAPGEAVLNRGAADHMGRGAIAALNALGAHTMTMQGTPPQMPPGGAGGPPPPRQAQSPGRGMLAPKKPAAKPAAKQK
jgi:hypothetical protein